MMTRNLNTFVRIIEATLDDRTVAIFAAIGLVIVLIMEFK